MRAIYIGICHDDDLVITKLTDIKIFVNSCSKSCDHSLDLFISVNFI